MLAMTSDDFSSSRRTDACAKRGACKNSASCLGSGPNLDGGAPSIENAHVKGARFPVLRSALRKMPQLARQHLPVRRNTWPFEGRLFGLLGCGPRGGFEVHMMGVRPPTGRGRGPGSLDSAHSNTSENRSAPDGLALIATQSQGDYLALRIRPSLLQDPRLRDVLGILSSQMGLHQGSASPAAFDVDSWSYMDHGVSSPTEELYRLPLLRSPSIPRALTLDLDESMQLETDSSDDDDTHVDGESNTTLAPPGSPTSYLSLSDRGFTLSPASPKTVGERRYSNASTGALTLGYRDIPALFATANGGLSRPRMIPEDWEEILHPEGSTYYISRQRRVITSARITNQTLRSLVEMFYAQIVNGSPLPPDAELVLDLDPDDSRRCSYYICSHDSRAVSWLSEISAYDAYFLGVKETSSEAHLWTQMTAFYSEHMQLYPHRALPKEAVIWILCEASYYYADTATNDSSTSPYKQQELKVILEFEQCTRGVALPAGALRRTCMLARFWQGFLTQKFLNYHHEDRVRLDRTTSIMDQEATLARRPCWLARLLTFALFFNVPNGYLRDIDRVWVDETCYGEHWEKFVEDLVSKWWQVTTLATILLTANVGFLAIPAVDDPGKMRTALHYISSISMLLSFASMFAGMLLVGIHHKSVTSNGGSGQLYFQRNQRFGLLFLASVYSLPQIFFIWSALTFAAAFFIFGLAGPSGLNIIFGIVFGMISLAVLTIVAFFWASPNNLPHTFQTFWYDYGEFNTLPQRIIEWLRDRNVLPLFNRVAPHREEGQ